MLIFADDTTLIAAGSDQNVTSAQINRDLLKIEAWALKWKVTFNGDKSKEMIFTKKDLGPCPPVMFCNYQVEKVISHRHLGVYLTPSLDWSVHVHQICLKANRKLAVLRSVKELNRSTLDLLYKLTVRSVIDYCMPVYYGNLKVSEINRLDQIQYRAAKLVTGALHFSSKLKLNIELGWESLKVRYECLGLSLFHLGCTRPLVKLFMPQLEINAHNTRGAIRYKQFPYCNKQYSLSFYPNFSKLLNKTQKTLQNERDLTEYKSKLYYVYKHPTMEAL